MISKDAFCLSQKKYPQIKIRDYKNFSLTGQFWNATEQCRMQYGPQATFCSVIIIK